jgi:hypothetical protein
VPVTNSFTLLLGAGVALFLAGVNLAFLLQLGGKLVGWFKFKIAAVTAILIYVCLSFSYGSPATSRVVVGWFGLALDLGAIFWMWSSIERARENEEIGLVPLIKAQDERD